MQRKFGRKESRQEGRKKERKNKRERGRKAGRKKLICLSIQCTFTQHFPHTHETLKKGKQMEHGHSSCGQVN